jgi:hypothetical protein
LNEGNTLLPIVRCYDYDYDNPKGRFYVARSYGEMNRDPRANIIEEDPRTSSRRNLGLEATPIPGYEPAPGVSFAGTMKNPDAEVVSLSSVDAKVLRLGCWTLTVSRTPYRGVLLRWEGVEKYISEEGAKSFVAALRELADWIEAGNGR